MNDINLKTYGVPWMHNMWLSIEQNGIFSNYISFLFGWWVMTSLNQVFSGYVLLKHWSSLSIVTVSIFSLFYYHVLFCLKKTIFNYIVCRNNRTWSSETNVVLVLQFYHNPQLLCPFTTVIKIIFIFYLLNMKLLLFLWTRYT